MLAFQDFIAWISKVAYGIGQFKQRNQLRSYFGPRLFPKRAEPDGYLVPVLVIYVIPKSPSWHMYLNTKLL